MDLRPTETHLEQIVQCGHNTKIVSRNCEHTQLLVANKGIWVK